MKEWFNLGDKVKVKSKIVACKDGWKREWKRLDIDQGITGIVIGRRFVKNGKTEGGYEEPLWFIAEKNIECYLVAYDLHKKPVHVLPEDLELEAV